jgi:hypothetical protein
MPSDIIPESDKPGDKKCARCQRAGQFPRLIVDPATGRKHNFFECVACGYPNWMELRDK